MPTKEELLKKYEVRREPSQDYNLGKEESNIATEEPTAQISKKQALLDKYEVKRESLEGKKQESEPWYKFKEPESTNPLENLERAGRSLALSAGEGISGGLDFIMKGFGGGRPVERTNPETGLPQNDKPFSLKEAFQKGTGFEATSFPERSVRTLFETGTGGLALPGGTNFSPGRVQSDLYFTGGYEGSKELGAGENESAATGVASSFIPAAVEIARNPRLAFVNAFNMFTRGMRPNANQVEGAAARQQIDLPATEVVDNPLIEMTSKAVANKKSVGPDWMQNIDRQYANAVNRTVRNDPLLRQASREVSGGQTAENVDQIFRDVDGSINRQYDIAKRADPKFRTTPQPLADVVNELRASLPPVSPETQSLHNTFNRIDNQINETVQRAQFNPQTQLIEMVPVRQVREMGLEEVMNLRASLGDLSRAVDTITGTRTLQRRLRPALNESLQELGTSNPDLYNRILRLDNVKYNLREEAFGLKVMDKLRQADRKGLTGEQAFKLIKDPEEYRAMANVMQSTPQGRRVLAEFNQNKVEEIFKNTIKEAQAGEFSQNSFIDMLNDPKKASWLNETMTPAMRQNVTDLQTLSNHLVNGGLQLKAKANVSKDRFDYLKASQIATGIGLLMAGHPVSAVVSALGPVATHFAAQAFTNPRFQRDLINAARASQNNQMAGFRRFMESAMHRIRNVAVLTSNDLGDNQSNSE